MTTNESSVNTYLSYLSSIYHLSFIIYHLSITSILSGYTWMGRMREGGEAEVCTGDGGGGERLYGWMEACMACVIDG